MNIFFKLDRTSVAQNEMGFEKCTQIKAIPPKGPVSATILHAMQESNGSALLKLRTSTSSLTLNEHAWLFAIVLCAILLKLI